MIIKYNNKVGKLLRRLFHTDFILCKYLLDLHTNHECSRQYSDQSSPAVISSLQEQPPRSSASARERLTNLFSRRLEVRLTNMAPTIVTHASPLNILHQQANNGANSGSAADSIMTSSSFGANSSGTADSLMVASSYGANSGRTADSVIVVTSSSPSNFGANSDHEEIIADTTLTPTQVRKLDLLFRYSHFKNFLFSCNLCQKYSIC